MYCTDSIKIESDNFEKREQNILLHIKRYYGQKLGREIPDEEAKDIADNLLHFAKALYET